MPSISEIVSVYPIAQYLAATDIARKGLYARGITVLLPQKIRNIGDSVQRIFDYDPNDTTLPLTANYLWTLCGIYGQQALSVIQQAGSIASITAPSAPAQLNFVVAASGTTLIDGQISTTLTAFIGFNLVVVKNGTSLTQITTAPVYYTWNKTSGLFTVVPAAFTGDEFQITAV